MPRNSKANDYVGKTIGWLTVVSANSGIVSCKCECGSVRDARLALLLLDESRGNIVSCGCRRSVNKPLPVVGERIGKLVIAEIREMKRGTRPFLCKCDCGRRCQITRRQIRARQLKVASGFLASCGCSQINRKNVGTSSYGYGKILAQYKNNAKNRDLLWELPDEYAVGLCNSNCSYCGSPPGKEHYLLGREKMLILWNGLDRKNSALGYTVENTVPCCATCNIAKRDTPYEEWIAYLVRIARFVATLAINKENVLSAR